MNVHNKQQQNHSNLYQQSTQSQMQQQQQLSFTNNNPLTCNICKKSFLKASSLNTHMISHTAKLYCYACNINFDDDALTYSQHMQMIHNVTMTKDLVSRAKANLQKSESLNLQQRLHADAEMQRNEDVENQEQEEIPRLKETFQVQSSSVENGQIPKLKITIKKEPMATTVIKQEPKEDNGGNESDSSSSSSSSNSSSSSSSSGSSSSSSSNDERRDNK
jgi:uncharacterized membrane protein YgcG